VCENSIHFRSAVKAQASLRGWARVPLTPTPFSEDAKCPVPECDGIRDSDPAFREGLWNRYFMAAGLEGDATA